jgi:hypothetical protein
MAGVDAGVLVTCNGCGNTVLQKAMVPVLVAAAPADGAPPEPAGAESMGYLCIPCARLRIDIRADEALPAG